MRNISFAMTTEQVRQQTKTVTRRTGWAHIKPGTLLQPVVKGMGLKKGERVEKIGGPIRVIGVRRENLQQLYAAPDGTLLYDGNYPYGYDELRREGFPSMRIADFIDMFAKSHGCGPVSIVTRIEFEYTEPARQTRTDTL